ncbi:MAG: stage V sporulation protein AA [Lachnospiraceae bacterium]
MQIHSRIVSFKDIAQIVADDSALENKIRVLKLPPDTVQGPGRYPVSVMTLIELIQQEFPGIEVNNIGEADFILTLEKRNSPGACMPGARPRWWPSSLFSGRPLPL